MLKYQTIPSRIIISVIKISMLINNIDCNHISNNDSDVIITHEGHAEANIERKPVLKANNASTLSTDEYLDSEKAFIPYTQTIEECKDVVFIPNVRIDELDRDSVNVGRLVNVKVNEDTESPNKDILFISGKNNENVDTDNKKQRNTPKHTETRRSGTKTDYKPKVVLNCKNLDCNNSVNSVCGGKMEHKQWRYRLFLNECFFRKVNCGFNHAENRYQKVPIERCRNIGAHISYRPYVYSPLHVTPSTQEAPEVKWRTQLSRRALNKGIDGIFCSHPCPVSCSDEYEPECAVSISGLRKVFVNHCKLDYHSCFNGVVWHKRPLSECVGGQKADLRQNRAFIGWMQKVGIVNEKGKLMLHR